ncbi:MAG TPA: multicopper oxidase domain-containing protein [Bacteroidia bacterium]|nr:multicopper oxidase domain-containing protein [Bacteroidia bacterium]
MKKVIIICLTAFNLNVFAQTQLAIPDTLAGPNYTLNMHQDSVQFFPTGNISHTYGFNQYQYLGPTLIFNKGSNVNITVNNQIGDTTTVHWHGIHLPSKWDGGPHTPILPSASWNPQFTVMDNAATYWYHPHMHMKTAEQAIKGAAGLIIVRDPIEAALTLPRKYGVDDFPLVIQVQQYDSLNQAMPLGMQDSTILVNGARANYGYSVYGNFPAQVVRMRILNASGERAFNFGFSGNKQFYQIASDGGLLDTPYLTTRVRLAPGERAEILLDLTGMNGQTLYLMSYASELTMGIQGGPTMPMPGGPPMDSPLNGIDFNIMQINVVPQTVNPVTTIPTILTTNSPYTAGMANVTRTIRFTADSLMVMDGPFYFNDSTFNMMRIDYQIPLNNIEIWKLVNETMVAHPFHIHDIQFFVIDRNGNPPGPEESGRKDVVLLPPGDSLMFITKFEDFADTIVPFMYHCHILMHEDDGMMGQFVVIPSTVGMTEIDVENDALVVYPNPATEKVHFQVKDISTIKQLNIVIYDQTGRLIFQSAINTSDSSIDISQWSKGFYTANIYDGQRIIHKKLIIQ